MSKELESSIDTDIPVLSSATMSDKIIAYDASAAANNRIKTSLLQVIYDLFKSSLDTAYGSFVTRWPAWGEVTSKPAVWAGAFRNEGNVTGTKNLDFTNYSLLQLTLTGNATLNFTTPNPLFYGVCALEVTQDGTGGHNITWGSGLRVAQTAPTPSVGASERDYYFFFFNGTEFVLIQHLSAVSTSGF